MRLLKKLVSGIAMTAMCCTLVVPIVSNAGTGTGACFGHVFVEWEYAYTDVLGSYTHEYTIDGKDYECIKQTLGHYYKSSCWECGYVTTELKDIEANHLNLNCPFKNQ